MINGKGQFKVADEPDLAVGPGSVLFVKAHVEHRFHTIEEDLDILVFFSSAKSK